MLQDEEGEGGGSFQKMQFFERFSLPSNNFFRCARLKVYLCKLTIFEKIQITRLGSNFRFESHKALTRFR